MSSEYKQTDPQFKIEKYKELAQLIESKGGEIISTIYTDSNGKIEFYCNNKHKLKLPAHHLFKGSWCKECKI